MKQKPFEELTIADVTAKQCTSCAFFTVSPVGICVAPCICTVSFKRCPLQIYGTSTASHAKNKCSAYKKYVSALFSAGSLHLHRLFPTAYGGAFFPNSRVNASDRINTNRRTMGLKQHLSHEVAKFC